MNTASSQERVVEAIKLRHGATCVRTVSREAIGVAQITLQENVKSGEMARAFKMARAVAERRGLTGDEAVAWACAMIVQDQFERMSAYFAERSSQLDAAADVAGGR